MKRFPNKMASSQINNLSPESTTLEGINNAHDNYTDRKKIIDLTRDAPLYDAKIINPPATVKLKTDVLERVELADVKDLHITTAGGKEVSKEDALKALAKGRFVVVSVDGNAVSPNFLKALKDDVLVLVSPEFVGVGDKKDKK